MNLTLLAKLCDLEQNKFPFWNFWLQTKLYQHHGNTAAECKRIRSYGYTAAILRGRPKGTETGQNESSICTAIWKEVKEKALEALMLTNPGCVK